MRAEGKAREELLVTICDAIDAGYKEMENVFRKLKEEGPLFESFVGDTSTIPAGGDMNANWPMFQNDKHKFKGIWEPAGKSYRKNLSLNEVVKLMGREIGIEVESPQLRALLSTFFNQHTKPTSFAYYTAEYKSGTTIVPEDCEEIGWFSLAEAGDKIDLEEMGLVARHVAAGNQNVLSGAVRVIKTSESRSIEIIEPFK